MSRDKQTEIANDLNNRVVAQIKIDDEKLEEIKNECLASMELDIKAIQADTVRETQERLKQAVKDIPWCEYLPVHNCIDQIAKEMLEGE